MTQPLKLLIAESETPAARQRRRDSTGRSSGETYAATLVEIEPGATVDLVRPAEDGAMTWSADDLAGYDGIFLSGSPLHAWEESPPVQRQKRFMRAAFASATPCFGSCAGLQIAVAAAGGVVRAKTARHEAGLARRIWATEPGRQHPLLAGRPTSWDALCIHADEVAQLPPGSVLLASNASTAVQAAEVRFGPGIFWGVQYHPELPLNEVAEALRRQSEGLIEQRLARSAAEIGAMADLLHELQEEPTRSDLLWRLGTDEQVSAAPLRTLELRNFIAHLVVSTRRDRDASRRAAKTPAAAA